MSFSWTELIPGVGHEYAHVATTSIATLALAGIALKARIDLGKGEKAIVPASSFGVRAIFEAITGYIDKLAVSVIGEHGRIYVPLFCSFFTYILFNNLIGAIPGMTPATENLNMTFSMAIFVFVMYNILGVKANGFGYLKHFLGPVWWLAPFMLVLELISHAVRPLSLGMRLGFVMLGDHTVLGVALDLAPLLVPILFYMLAFIVSLIQAIVFTLLSMVYVAMATSHDH
jgi:F-type H+-transporting ATPase subunit a